MKAGTVYFRNLDAIRFFAALMVFLQHGFKSSFALLPIKGTVLEKFLKLISTGALGVSIFFVLSGFLITYLLIKEYEKTSGINIKQFYIRRILRIWPLYFAVVIFSFFIYPGLKSLVFDLNNHLSSNVFYHLVFLSNFDVLHMEKFFRGNEALSQNITWSVSIEEQFYLFWPLIFAFLPKKFWFRSIVFVILTSLVFRIFHSTDPVVLYFHTLSVLVDLGIGGLFALICIKYKPVISFFEKCSTGLHLTFFLFSFLLLWFNETIFQFQYGGAINRVFIAISFALIICSQAFTLSDSPLNLGKIKFASRLGKYTYGIYLLHPIIINSFDVIYKSTDITKTTFTSSFLFGSLCLFVTLIVSKLSYKYFETPFLKLKDRFSVIDTKH